MSARHKPRDVGNGLVCASFGRGGEWLSLATVDPTAGFVELTGLPLFDPELRGHAEAVLRYRSWMRREEHAFLRVEAGRATVTTREDAPRGTHAVVQRLIIRASRLDRPSGIRVRVSGRLAVPPLAELREADAPPVAGLASAHAAASDLDAPEPGRAVGPGEAGLTDDRAADDRAADDRLTDDHAAGDRLSDGRAAGDRAADDRAAGDPKSRVKAREGTLRVTGEGAPVIIQAWLRQGGDSSRGSAERRADKRLAWTVLRRRMPSAVAWIEWPADTEELHLDIACAFDRPAAAAPDWLSDAASPSGSTPGPAGSPVERPDSGASRADARPARADARPHRSDARPQRSDARPARVDVRPLRVPARLVKPIGRLDQRAASYTRACTALQVAGGERCILADHRILPLSRNGDAYWQARLLLASWQRGGHDEDALIVADHLRWLYLRCERPDGRWRRSHHADGRPRDRAFRADQQLYPLLELAEYASLTGSLPALPPGRSWVDLTGEAWAAIESAIDRDSGLLTTEVTPADDTPDYPCLASDQVLLWHTAMRLVDVAGELALATPSLVERVERTRAAFGTHMVVDGPSGPQWAYAVDGRGGVELGVDATDLPVALAPLWGFCKPTDRAWRNTVTYAFEEANPGFVAGIAGGLGSRHTPGTWTLGDIFGWVAHGLTGDQEASEAALTRLVTVAFNDGMLPEAYDPDGSGDVVRHWFALPGALLGTLILEHAARGSSSEPR